MTERKRWLAGCLSALLSLPLAEHLDVRRHLPRR
ncbi:hypothetical protein, partial [Pseudomonas aeruginosa]